MVTAIGRAGIYCRMNAAGTRRSRYHRAPTGKRLELTARDIEIFKLLQRYRYLRSTYIHAFVGGASETRFKERLGHLYHEGGYIVRPAEQWQAFNARYAPAIYELGEAGQEHLSSQRSTVASAGGWSRQERTGDDRQFAHALMICDTLASIELGTRASQNIRFIPSSEILERAARSKHVEANPLAVPVSISHTFPGSKTEQARFNLVPDALFGLEYASGDTKLYRFFALEAERKNRVRCGNLQQTSWLKKVLAYREVVAQKLHQSHFGVPNLMVVAVAPTVAHIESMKALVMELTGGKGSTVFLFRSIPAFADGLRAPAPMPDLFSSAWDRAGRDPFCLNVP